MAIHSDEGGMTLVVKTVTRLTVGLIFLYGVYIVLNGHLSPGGGFAGGVIIALSFMNLVLAFGGKKAVEIVKKNAVTAMESIGAILFLGIALLGFTEGGFFRSFLSQGETFKLISGGTIPLSNIAICIKVGAGLFGIFLTLMVLMGSERKEK
jgi:multicomponent Na+:H+ antiporter subunit B